jgi:ribosomal protein S18 acetylase RimI-like enzyme
MSEGGVEIVEARSASELEAVRALFREYEQAIGVSLCFQGFEEELAGLPEPYVPPRGRLLLAMAGDQPLGCVALRPLEGEVAELKRLYVRPVARGQGLGRQLASSAVEVAREVGYRCVRLDTLASMTEAIALYRSLGFVEIPPYTPNPLPSPVFLELALS